MGDGERGQNKSWFLAWVSSLKSGKRKESFNILVQINLPTSTSTLKHSSLFINHLGIFQIQEGCILNAFVEQHSCEMHPCAFFRYIFQLHFSAILKITKIINKDPDLKSWKEGKAMEKSLHTIQNHSHLQNKYETMLNTPHNPRQKGNMVQRLTQSTR